MEFSYFSLCLLPHLSSGHHWEGSCSTLTALWKVLIHIDRIPPPYLRPDDILKRLTRTFGLTLSPAAGLNKIELGGHTALSSSCASHPIQHFSLQLWVGSSPWEKALKLKQHSRLSLSLPRELCIPQYCLMTWKRQQEFVKLLFRGWRLFKAS